MFFEQSCDMCIHSDLAENFPECPFFEREEDGEDCRNWLLDLDKV